RHIETLVRIGELERARFSTVRKIHPEAPARGDYDLARVAMGMATALDAGRCAVHVEDAFNLERDVTAGFNGSEHAALVERVRQLDPSHIREAHRNSTLQGDDGK